jgi:hypothetical protein
VIVFALGIIIIFELRKAHEHIMYNSRMSAEDSSFLVHEFQSISNFKECFCCVLCVKERTQKGANCW